MADPEVTRQYLTLLNLRSCDVLHGKVRTEQIYVHSKLLIADDRLAIVGSANINDRSLKGDRDSEIAACIMDTAIADVALDGKRVVKVRCAAHDLRVALWRKHFGLHAKSQVVHPATELAAMVDKPADSNTWQAIQRVADANLDAYAAAFPAVPDDNRSIWPVWPTGEKEKDRARLRALGPRYENQMPFAGGFWDVSRSVVMPSPIKGFVCALPLGWTRGENNHPEMNMALLTHQTSDPVEAIAEHQSRQANQGARA
jgi:phospholipase D1/2